MRCTRPAEHCSSGVPPSDNEQQLCLRVPGQLRLIAHALRTRQPLAELRACLAVRDSAPGAALLGAVALTRAAL
jgi:hypothetical protein